MNPVATQSRDELVDKANSIGALVSPPESQDEGGSESAVERRAEWLGLVQNVVLDLSNSLPEGTSDYDMSRLLTFMVELGRAIEADPDATDVNGAVELATMKMRDVVARIARRLVHNSLDDPHNAVEYVFEALDGVQSAQIAHILGVSAKTIGTWRAGGPVSRHTNRVVLVAQIITYIRSSLTPKGIVMWFDAERHQLGDRSPIELLDKDVSTAQEVLIPLARGARGQLAG